MDIRVITGGVGLKAMNDDSNPADRRAESAVNSPADSLVDVLVESLAGISAESPASILVDIPAENLADIPGGIPADIARTHPALFKTYLPSHSILEIPRPWWEGSLESGMGGCHDVNRARYVLKKPSPCQ